MRVPVIGLLLVVACSTASETSTPAAAVGAPLSGCDAGTLEDCFETAWRKIGARGTAIDVAGAEKLAAKACAGKLVKACGMAAWLVAERGEELAADRRSGLDRDCRAGDGWSCAALTSWALRPASTGGGMRDTGSGATWAELGCRAGQMWCCGTLDSILLQAAALPDLKQAGRERLSALQAMVDEKRALACKAGKRDGCREGTREYEELVRKDCAGGDHGACSEIADSSQDVAEAMRAAKDACDQGKVTSACGLVCNGLRDGALGEPDLAAARACFDRVCKAGEQLACKALAAGPMLGGGCRAVDLAHEPHLDLRALPRLTAPRQGGGTFDSAKRTSSARLYVFTASWSVAGGPADLSPLAADLKPLGVELVAVLSDASWDAVRGLDDVGGLVAVLDEPAPGANIGRYTGALGITKVPEALVVDSSGAVLRHVVGPGILTSRLNGRRCVQEVLKHPE